MPGSAVFPLTPFKQASSKRGKPELVAMLASRILPLAATFAEMTQRPSSPARFEAVGVILFANVERVLRIHASADQ